MNCAEKLSEPTIHLILHTKPPQKPGSESPWRKRDPSPTWNLKTKPQYRLQNFENALRSLRHRQPCPSLWANNPLWALKPATQLDAPAKRTSPEVFQNRNLRGIKNRTKNKYNILLEAREESCQVLQSKK